MKKILVSACLAGFPVRYDGRVKVADSALIERWRSQGRLVTVCPEVAAGLAIPRAPAEITGGDGYTVLHGPGRVVEITGKDVTVLYKAGALHALDLARQCGIAVAVLTDGSPSCGSTFIHNGQFSGQVRTGRGVTAAILEAAGIKVFSESGFAQADAYLQSLE